MIRVDVASIITGGLVILAGAVSLVLLGSAREARSLDRRWADLEVIGEGERFDAAMVAGLPAPAQRYFLHAIAPGTPLARHAVLRMHGAIRLKDDAEPTPMHAEQVLAPPVGFIWKARVGSGVMRIRGSDAYVGGHGRMRWRLWGLIPVVDQADADTDRSAAGRLGGEAALVPSTLLPANGAVWDAVDDSAARVTLDVHGEAVTFIIAVDETGRMTRVVIRRWNGDPANGDIGYMPFVVEFEGEATFDGYTIPTQLVAGWEREGRWRPFFFAELDAASFR
jgi:hypothetical protein